MDKFLAKINEDPSNRQIPQWKRLMLAKKALEKARKEAESNLIRKEEEKRMKNIPEWKVNLVNLMNNKKEETSKSETFNKM